VLSDGAKNFVNITTHNCQFSQRKVLAHISKYKRVLVQYLKKQLQDQLHPLETLFGKRAQISDRVNPIIVDKECTRDAACSILAKDTFSRYGIIFSIIYVTAAS